MLLDWTSIAKVKCLVPFFLSEPHLGTYWVSSVTWWFHCFYHSDQFGLQTSGLATIWIKMKPSRPQPSWKWNCGLITCWHTQQWGCFYINITQNCGYQQLYGQSCKWCNVLQSFQQNWRYVCQSKWPLVSHLGFELASYKLGLCGESYWLTRWL